MNSEQVLREAIRKIIREIISEVTTTGNVAGYLTPGAFRGNSKSNINKVKKIATQFGYSLTDRGQEDLERKADNLRENTQKLDNLLSEKIRYHEYRKEFKESPYRKLAEAIAGINRELKEINRFISMNQKLKKEYGITSETLWKRTQTGLTKLESKLITIAGKIREIRGQ